MIKCRPECGNYVTFLSLHAYPYCSRIVLTQRLSQTLERSQILRLFTKKRTSRQLIIINQSPCYPFLGNFLKELISIHFLSILNRIIYFVLISLDSDLLLLVNINFTQYCMKFINLLIVTYRKISGVFPQIFQKHSQECGMMGSTGSFKWTIIFIGTSLCWCT